LIKATRDDRWYVRDVTEFIDPRSLIDDINKGSIYLLYTEDVSESIRVAVENSKLSYNNFLLRAEAAMKEEAVSRLSYYDTGKVTYLTIQKDNISQIKKYR
jgi:hypothetical protein